MSDSLILTRQRLLIMTMALMAAATHSTNAESEYQTLKQFIETHPDQQLFELTIKKEKNKHHA